MNDIGAFAIAEMLPGCRRGGRCKGKGLWTRTRSPGRRRHTPRPHPTGSSAACRAVCWPPSPRSASSSCPSCVDGIQRYRVLLCPVIRSTDQSKLPFVYQLGRAEHDVRQRRLDELPTRNWSDGFSQTRRQSELDILHQYFLQRLVKHNSVNSINTQTNKTNTITKNNKKTKRAELLSTISKSILLQ